MDSSPDLKTISNVAGFFYGTLMHPNILRRVIGHDGRDLQICPAILLDYTRHQVKFEDYPGILPYSRSRPLFGRELETEEKSVRGMLVVGLSNSDLDFLDVFEGDEYSRERVLVHPLEPLVSLSESATFKAGSLVAAAAPFELVDPVEAETYVYSSMSDLKAELWSFDDFVNNNAWKWIGSANRDYRDHYAEVDRRRGTDMSCHDVT